MLRAIRKLDPSAIEAQSGAPAATLTLPFESRQKSRLRARLDDGRELALTLPRGSVLRGGDHLLTEDGRLIEVRAAIERVSTARSTDARCLCRVAYHLGNRHVPVQIGDCFVRYLHDAVLDHLVEHLGLEVERECAPFEPETGAYGGGHHHA